MKRVPQLCSSAFTHFSFPSISRGCLLICCRRCERIKRLHNEMSSIDTIDYAHVCQKENEEKLREAACVGDEDTVRVLLEKDISVDAHNAMNGWTALHWAAKRGHVGVIMRLLEGGAKTNLKTLKGETAANLTSEPDIQRVLGGEMNGNVTSSELPITPNYLRHPVFPYAGSADGLQPKATYPSSTVPTEQFGLPAGYSTKGRKMDEELVLKARLAGTGDPDFIEVELPYKSLSYEQMLIVLAKELNVDKAAIQKVRKLPNTIVRKDKDVQRLHDFQEMEVILTAYAITQHSRHTGGPTPRHIDVVY